MRLLNGETKRIRVRGKTKAEATRKVKALAANAVALRDNDELRTNSTIAELVDHWLNHHDGAAGTVDVYRSTARNHITPNIGELRLNEVRPSTMQAFLHRLEEMPATAKRARSILSSAFGLAVRQDLITSNPIRETLPPKQKRGEVRAFEGDELATFLAMVDHYTTSGRKGRGAAFPRLVRFLAGTGVRLSEALSIRASDVDLDAETPTAIVRPTKDGGTSTRVVQLPKIAADAARDQLRDTGGTFDWLFPTSTGTHISKSTAERWMREARHEWEKANEAKGRPDVSWVTFHTMRKHVATVLSERVSVNAATQQLGHADTTVTQHHYISRPKAGPAVAEVLNDHLFPSESGQKVAK
ncbi:tyrosine-type recombinase/integrase [Corynebacterium sp. CNCTC7651]|uniref:tyrosine-type recombinase/integrase n=1 Tax=Corynebacterium sp. CNCTC7651 TaxID=2815361 RepID=UPI001F40C120|nr:site-specific integrase [Corynebacterium sp. CNCTC7651]UIZ91797.1 tyrosine-type recombinase/integrase [Corynebacterium sp. CNCTC7651]